MGEPGDAPAVVVDDEKPGQWSQIPLSVLIDRMCVSSAARDAAFVRRFSGWMHDHRDRLRLEPVTTLGLEDVVMTFQMKRSVSLVITGYVPNNQPGAVTVQIGEEDFPFVNVTLEATPHEAPYDICTMDYSFAGRVVELSSGPYAGSHGEMLVAATVGAEQTARIRLDDGTVIQVEASDLVLSS